MTLINGHGELKDCKVSGYDKVVEYHFQCKANERHEGKWHDDEGNIIVNVKDDKDPIHEKIHLSKCAYWCDISTEKQIAVFRILIPKIGDGNYSGSVSTTQTTPPSTFLRNWFK